MASAARGVSSWAAVAVAAALVTHAGDRDHHVTGTRLTGARYGVASGPATGGLADGSLTAVGAGRVMRGTSGRCYGWTRSGRVSPARCP